MTTPKTPSFASSSSSSSTSIALWKYDVFLSFGEDTSNSFSDHLYRGLERKGIDTFRGYEKLEKGETPNRLKAIDESRLAIVVFSREYPSSAERLDELVKIAEMKLRVFPVFCNVEPSEVRKQNGTFGDAFTLLLAREDLKWKANKWREVLTEMANNAGWELRNKYESEVIEEIAKNISDILNSTSSSGDVDLVGIKYRIVKLLPYLGIGDSDDVRVIGIWGMPGIGKTTLAQEVFEKIRNCFEASCFIENVREKFKSKCDVVALQKIVFKELLNEEHPKIQNSREGMKKLRDKLRSRKVLIILDDADESDQIKNLTGDRNLKPGSRIIVTTRNNHLLKEFGENNVFKVDNLAKDEALKLLSKKAFNKEYPPKEYEEVCKLVVRYAGGLPLALNVLGSFLVKRTVKEWFSTLDRLQEYLDEEDIVSVLRISVDGLKDSERELFLDIACFFKGEPRHRVEKILETRDRELNINIEVLVEKALIRIGGKDSCLWMHDLLQELGWEYVRRKHFTKGGRVMEKLGKRSRLWVPEDIIDVLTKNSGTEAVKGIFLTFPEKKDVVLKYDPFPKMRKLKLLKIHNANFSEHPTYLCNELQLLEWHDYQSTSLPSSFQPENLVELNLPNSSIEQLWEESGKVLKKLLWINLSYCRCLTQTINFSTAPNLERLTLKGCGNLSEVHPSIEVLKNLVSLNLEGCNNLSSLPDSICGLTSLKTLYLCGCSHLDHLPENLGGLERLEVLDASGTGIRKVPSSITDLNNLIVLSFSGCKGVALDTEGCSEPIGLQLPNSFAGLVSLRSLDLSGCNLSEGAIPQDIGCLSSLQSLDLSENNFISIPDSMSKLPKLRALRLNRCHKLRRLPKPPFINLIEARDCAELRNNPNKQTVWTSDGGLCLIDCSNLDEEKNDVKWHLTQIPREHYPLQLRKYFKDAIYQGRTAQLVESIGDRVPDWCSHSRNASSITVQLSDPNLDGDSTWMGIALYIVYKNPKQRQFFDKRLIESAGFPGFDNVITELKFDFETGEGGLGKSLVENVSLYGGSNGLFRYVPREWFSVEFHFATSITTSVSFSDPKLEVKMCGAHVVTKQNVAEFTGNLCRRDANEEYAAQHFNEIIDNVVKSKVSINEMESAINECLMIGNKRLIEWRQLSTSKYPPPETSRKECSSPNPFFIHIEETNSISSDTSKLRDELKPLLSDLFEGNPARNFCACIFPVKAILPRFTYQCVGNQVHCCLPQGLYDDKTWVGFSLYVVLTWHPSASLNDFNLKDQLPMLSVDMVVLGVEIFTEQFPLKKDDLVGLNRLVLFYMPRVAFSEFWLKKGCSISSLFRTTIPDEVDIEICGIRLVYEEELEEITETVSECTLHSPEIYHQRYCRNFAKMKNGESTIGERVMMGGEMTLDLGFARCFGSNLNFPNQQEPEQSSNSKRDIVEKRLLQKYFQGFDQWSTYNSCFPPSEIPEWFNDHSNDGPSVKIQLPSNLHDDSNWTGLALWASFCTTESPTVIGDNRFSSSPHFLICNLETNRGRLEPLHVYQTTKEEFKWLHVGGFIWLCYIPRASCFHLLNQCEFLEASFGSDRPGLWAHKSALRLMYKNDGHDLGNIILHCMEIFWDNWDLIADSATEVTSKHLKPTFIILSMMAETPLHRIDSPTLWQSNLKKLLQHFFKFTLLVNFTIEGHFISTFRGFDPDHTYNFGFPHKEILEWFPYQNCSSQVEMPLPKKDLCNDSNWAGLVMCAYFEVQEPPTVILEDFGSRIYARLLCHLQLQDKCLDSGPMFNISKEKFKWFYLRGFIWITYIPRLSFPDVLNNVTSVEASFHSPDCSSLVVKKCGIRLLYQHEVEEFKQTIIQYMTSFFDDLNPICEYISDENEKKYHLRNREISGIFRNPFLGTQHKRSRESTSHGEISGVDNSFENLHHSKRTKLHNQVEARELQDFDRNFIYNSVFPCVEIIEWFSHRDVGPAVSIQKLPQSLESDNNWIGLALCAYFSNADDPQPTTFIDHMDTEIRHHLISLLQSDRGSLEQLLIYRTNNEEFKWLNHRGQFFWLLFIPRKCFLGKLNECSSLKATFVSDNGSLCVKKCGLRLVYRHEEDEFKQTILHCVNSLAGEESTNQDNVGEVGSSTRASSLNIDSQGQQEEARGRSNDDFKSKGKRVME